MPEEIALIIVWVAICLIGLWAGLRFLPNLIKFFSGELRQAKDKITGEDTLIIKVKKESKKEKSDA
jgi:hypothetical protein